jgi:16S rRNA (cytosine967-C5)-methyltransferase
MSQPASPAHPPSVPHHADGISTPLLNAAIDATRELLDFSRPADASLSAFFRTHKSGSRDRAFIAETAYAVLRRKRWLAKLAGPGSPLRLMVLLALARLQGFSQRQLEAALRPAERDWLAHARQQPEPDLSLGEQADMPEWLVERLATQMGTEELLSLARALNTPAPLDLRVNSFKAERTAVVAALAADGFSTALCPLSPVGLRVKGKPALQKHPLFLNGSIEIQDEGSQLLGYLLAPKRGEMIVDFCAGAGGKTLLLGALMRSTGRLYAFDVADRRLAKLKPRVARSGLSNVHPACIAGENDTRINRLAGKIDRVLVDAPCSGLGTLRRNPDLKWRQTPLGIADLVLKQASILAAASRLLKVGGRLVYATCSILDEENVRIVDAFLAATPGFVRVSAQDILAAQGITLACGDDMNLSPERHCTDGFYAAVLERRT